MTDKSYLEEFKSTAPILYRDEKIGLEIYGGELFEAKTVKGGTNLIVAMRVIDGYMHYIHGDKPKKVLLSEFIRAVEYGDLQPRHPKEIDPDRLSSLAIGLDAVANRRTGPQQIDYLEEQAINKLKLD